MYCKTQNVLLYYLGVEQDAGKKVLYIVSRINFIFLM